MDNDVEHLFMHLLAICVSLGKCLFGGLAYFYSIIYFIIYLFIYLFNFLVKATLS